MPAVGRGALSRFAGGTTEGAVRSRIERWRRNEPIESPRAPSVLARTNGTNMTAAQIPARINNTNVVNAPRPTLPSRGPYRAEHAPRWMLCQPARSAYQARVLPVVIGETLAALLGSCHWC